MTSLQQEVKKLREFMEANQISASTFAVSTLTATTIGATATKSLAIEAVAGKDIVMNMGDKAAATKVSFTDSDDSEQGYIDSDGTFYAKTSIAPMKYAHTDTDGAPTNAECVSAFGAAATVGSGFVGVYQDDHAGGVSYLCISNGTNYDVIAASAAA